MKKIIALLLVISTTVALSIGGTLAYLTDRDSEANVFTTGDVNIDLNEDFNQGSTLIPGVDIEKEPTVTNVGPNDAWVWTQIAIPAALDSDDASKNVIHFNYSNEDGYNWTWTDNGQWLVEQVKIGDVMYNVYTALYDEVLKVGETTEYPVIHKVYMDHHVDIDPDGNWHHVENGVVTDIAWNSETNGNPIIYVSAYAMQATEPFTSALDAYKAYNKQWTTDADVNNGLEWGTPSTVTTVSTADELTAALANGGTVVLTTDISLTNDKIIVAADAKATLNLNGNTLTVESNESKASCAIENKGELTIKNGTITYAGVGDPNFGYGTNTINNTGKLVIDGATIINTTDSGSSVAIDCSSGAELIINSGEIKSMKNAIRLCPFGNGAINCTINGGTITGARAVQIHLPSSNSASAPEIKLTVNGGTLNGTGGMSIYSYSYGQSFENVIVNLAGGVFNNDVCFGGGTAKTTQEKVTVSGGTFNGELGRYLANDGWEDIAKP